MASRPIDIRQFALLMLPLLLTNCATTSSAPPVPVPPPAALVVTAPVAHSGDWRDWPLTAGTWRYEPGTPISAARYGTSQASQFVVLCDATKRQVTLMRTGTASQIEIIASSRSARFPAGHLDERGVAMSAVVLSAGDSFLDVMAFSRGRIAVRSPGLADLAIPAWAEPARAIEDCRK